MGGNAEGPRREAGEGSRWPGHRRAWPGELRQARRCVRALAAPQNSSCKVAATPGHHEACAGLRGAHQGGPDATGPPPGICSSARCHLRPGKRTPLSARAANASASASASTVSAPGRAQACVRQLMGSTAGDCRDCMKPGTGVAGAAGGVAGAAERV